MATRIAINGYGRIGKNVLRALYEREDKDRFEIVAINDLGSPEINHHLTQFDSVHGRFPHDVTLDGDILSIDGKDNVQLLQLSEPVQLPWSSLGIDVVLECTGRFLDRDKASLHLSQGAKKVLLSAPSKDPDAMVVYGVNHQALTPEDRIVSNASCTTNCLAPMAKVLNDALGIEQGMMTTVHAYTNDQVNHDSVHYDLYRARACGLSMIPTKTGAAAAVGKVLPELDGKIDGMAVRVPTANVSLVDFHFLAKRQPSVEEVNRVLLEASQNQLKGVLAYSDLPLVSVDFNHTPVSCHFDAKQTMVKDRWVKVMGWYDNEWGFANRLLDVTDYLSCL